MTMVIQTSLQIYIIDYNTIFPASTHTQLSKCFSDQWAIICVLYDGFFFFEKKQRSSPSLLGPEMKVKCLLLGWEKNCWPDSKIQLFDKNNLSAGLVKKNVPPPQKKKNVAKKCYIFFSPHPPQISNGVCPLEWVHVS